MTPRSIVLFLSLLVGILTCSPKSHAGASNKNGNPFGNGTFFQTTGTFSAVVRGQNLSGTMLFSSGVNNNTNSAVNSSSGTTTISYLGGDGARAGIYIGNAAGFWDPSSGSITGQLWGGLTLSRTNAAQIYPEMYNNSNNPLSPSSPLNPNYDPTAPSFPDLVETITNIVIQSVDTNGLPFVTTVIATNTIYVMPVGNNVFNDTAYMSGNFSGKTANNYPNQTFTAQGMLVQQQLAPQQAGIITNANGTISTDSFTEGTTPVQMNGDLQIPITVQGIRVSDNYSSFSTISNSVPYAWTTYSITNFANFGMQQ